MNDQVLSIYLYLIAALFFVICFIGICKKYKAKNREKLERDVLLKAYIDCTYHKYDENTVWTDFRGNSIKIKDLADDHLVNIIIYVHEHLFERKNNIFHKNLFDTLVDQARNVRGLSIALITAGQIPYLNPDNKWEKWDYKIDGPVVLSEKEAMVYQ